MRYQLKQTLAVARRWSSVVASMASHCESSKSARPACGIVVVGPDSGAAGFQIGANSPGISILDFSHRGIATGRLPTTPVLRSQVDHGVGPAERGILNGLPRCSQ